jgi:hypothetical protein
MARLAPCRRSGIAKPWDDPGSAAHHFVLRCAREKRRNGILNPGKVL